MLQRLLLVLSTLASTSFVGPAQAWQDGAPGDGYLFGEFLGEFTGPLDPTDLVITPNNSIVVVERGAHRIRVFDPNGIPLRSWGGRGSNPGQLRAPHGIAMTDDEVFVTDSGNHRVQVFTHQGGHLRHWGDLGANEGQFNQPAGIAVQDGHVFVADSGNDRIQVFKADGSFVMSFGGFGRDEGRFIAPLDVVVDGHGDILVADTGNNRIQKFDSAGRFLKRWGDWGPFPGLFDRPTSLLLDAERLLVVDQQNHRVQAFSLEGAHLFSWGVHELVPHTGGGTLHYPASLAIAPSGEFAVIAETVEDRCQIFAHRPADAGPAPPAPPFNKEMQTHFGRHLDIDDKLLTIADPELHVVHIFDISREVPIHISRFGERGEKFGLMISSSGLEIDLDERRLLVSDLVTRRLQEYRLDYDPEARLKQWPDMATFARAVDFDFLRGEMPDPQPMWPIEAASMQRDSDGNLYVLDTRNAAVFVFDEQFRFIRAWGGHGDGPGLFSTPVDLAFNRAGNVIYIADALNARIQAFDREGGYLFEWGGPGDRPGQFVEPGGIAAGTDGFVYVSDAGADRILKFDEAGTFITQWGSRGFGMGEFWKPRGVAQDDSGRVFVIDQGNHRGQIFSPEGEWLVIFGTGRSYTRTRPLRPRTEDDR